ncbi:hypothetical protein AVEN_73910-1 [Araneus ventricosus]|uniref:Uncharacterized protein n=1 Tax=Araneus ventricosus TaxID=182803 RepID=A0A4Y2JJ03_ARAVE|nr:hypothetical protein AVEN_73910-1 [Araneus ventricosus]
MQIRLKRHKGSGGKSTQGFSPPIHIPSFLNRTLKASSGRGCLRSGKPYGRMAIQAGKSLTSCPQLVSVPLTGLERMLSSSVNMDLSLPTSKDFTCLTASIAVVVELARHFTMPRSVSIQCLSI